MLRLKRFGGNANGPALTEGTDTDEEWWETHQ